MAITLRRLFRNYISLIGGILAGLSFIVNVFLLFLDFLSPTQNPYVGIITYMILPGVTLTGLGLVFGGAALRFFQLRRGAVVVELPKLDLSNRPASLRAVRHVPDDHSFPWAIRRRGIRELPLHRLGRVLRHDLSHGDGAGVHGLPKLRARTRRMRLVSYRAGGRVVRAVQDQRRLPGVFGASSTSSRGRFPRPSATCAPPRTSASSATGRPSFGGSSWPRGSTFPRMRKTLGAKSTCSSRRVAADSTG